METTSTATPCDQIVTTNTYEVQTGMNKGSYTTQHTFHTEPEATKCYEDIKVSRGQKKRLLCNGVSLKRLMS